MFNSSLYQNSAPAAAAALEVAGEAARHLLFVPLRQTRLTGQVLGPLADLTLTHTFAYPRSVGLRSIEAHYRFPLPGDAAVRGVRVRFGEVEIEARLERRARAEADYAEARQTGRAAALLTRESPDVFTLSLTGLEPETPVEIETHYIQLARAEAGGWGLRLPLTTAPRYSRSDERDARSASGQPLATWRDPGHRFALDLSMVGASLPPSSPTHTLVVAPGAEPDSWRVQLAGGEVLPDRDCLLRWVAPASERASLRLWAEPRDGGHDFLALVAPPAEVGALLAREVVLLVDRSGSMDGPKWAAAQWAVQRFLDDLTPADRVAVGLFDDRLDWLAGGPAAATPALVSRLQAAVAAAGPRGGTELGVALEAALRLARPAGELARHLLIVTDAQVTDAGRIVGLVEAEASVPARRRVSLLCIDAAPNSALVEEIARVSGGHAVYLTSAPDAGDITTALDEVLTTWAAPAMVDLRLAVTGDGLVAAREMVRDGAIDVGDLLPGVPRWVAGRVRTADGGLPRARLLAGASGTAEVAVATAVAAPAMGAALAALSGAARLAALERLTTRGLDDAVLHAGLRRLGFDPAVVLPATRPAVYAETARHEVETALADLIAGEALAAGLVSAETAFVAVRREAGQVIEASVLVANALPAGWDDQFATGSGAAPMTAAAPPPRLARQRAFRAMPPSAAAAAPPNFLAEAPPSAQASTPSGPATPGPASPGGMLDALAGLAAPLLRRPSASSPQEPSTPRPATLRYASRPVLIDGTAVLLNAVTLPTGATLSRLHVRLPAGGPAPRGRGLALLLYAGDRTTPRARVALADLLRRGGERPLNIRLEAGVPLWLELVDPDGEWAASAPELEVELG